jgi:DMSO reductase anchor subunit
MLIWLGLWLVVVYVGGDGLEAASYRLWAVAACAATVLVTVGLSSSMLHLGKPARAWRSFSQWRTSWLSREGVMALATYLPIAALLVSMRPALTQSSAHSALDSPILLLSAAAMAVCAVATVICTAMIYASLKTIPAWRHRLVVPVYGAFALLSGGALLAAIYASAGSSDSGVRVFAGMIAALALATAAVKLMYWRTLDAQTLPVARGDAVGMAGREISVFERPHTEESYVTREMEFSLARRHAQTLRTIALVLFGLLPLASSAIAWWVPVVDGLAFSVATLGVLAGAFVERWLFFAEARHVV